VKLVPLSDGTMKAVSDKNYSRVEEHIQIDERDVTRITWTFEELGPDEEDVQMTDATRKYFEKIEWDEGHGQCPQCEGCEPGVGWWTDTVGHKQSCLLAQAMKNYGMEPVWEHSNPERTVGHYVGEGGFINFIRHDDPEKKKKLALAIKQRKAVYDPIIAETLKEGGSGDK
jgi:hypothetical protein